MKQNGHSLVKNFLCNLSSYIHRSTLISPLFPTPPVRCRCPPPPHAKDVGHGRHEAVHGARGVQRPGLQRKSGRILLRRGALADLHPDKALRRDERGHPLSAGGAGRPPAPARPPMAPGSFGGAAELLAREPQLTPIHADRTADAAGGVRSRRGAPYVVITRVGILSMVCSREGCNRS